MSFKDVLCPSNCGSFLISGLVSEGKSELELDPEDRSILDHYEVA